MTDTASILRRVTALIASGQHLDQVPGLPGVGLTDGGWFSGGRRIYWRGTEEFAAAAAEGLLDRLPAPPPPASQAAIEEAESMVGAFLPGLLKSMYGVANGGFGPGYGVLGLRGGFSDDTGRTAMDLLNEVPRGFFAGMPSGLLPLCHWGCAIYTFLHCPSGRVFGWDPNPVEPDDDIPFFEQEYFIDTWLEAWLNETLQQPWLTYDPESRTYRGATIEETRSATMELSDSSSRSCRTPRGRAPVVAGQNGFVRTMDWRVNGSGDPIGLRTRTHAQPSTGRAV